MERRSESSPVVEHGAEANDAGARHAREVARPARGAVHPADGVLPSWRMLAVRQAAHGHPALRTEERARVVDVERASARADVGAEDERAAPCDLRPHRRGAAEQERLSNYRADHRNIHWISHEAVHPANNEVLGRSNRRGRAQSFNHKPPE